MDQCEVIPNYSILFFFPLFSSNGLFPTINFSYQFLTSQFLLYQFLYKISFPNPLFLPYIYIHILFPVSQHSYSFSLSFWSSRNPNPLIKKHKTKVTSVFFSYNGWNHLEPPSHHPPPPSQIPPQQAPQHYPPHPPSSCCPKSHPPDPQRSEHSPGLS